MVGKRQSDRWRRHKSTLPEVTGRRGSHESDKAETNENKRFKGALLSLNTQMIKYSLPNSAMGSFTRLRLGHILVSRVMRGQKMLIQIEAADCTLQHRVYYTDDVFSVTSA